MDEGISMIGCGFVVTNTNGCVNQHDRMWIDSHKYQLLLQVVYGHVAGVLLLHEKESWFGLLGTTLIACGAVGANLFKPKPTAQDTGGTQVCALI